MADASNSSGAKAVVIQLKQLWDRQPKGRKTLAVLVLVGVIGVIALASLVRHTETWSAVADTASPDDAQELMAALQTRGIDARLREGKVEVESEQLVEARAIAAAAGLPRTGVGMELFDKSSLGQSSYAEQINYVRALQGELARSIAAMAQVQGARVHLSLGKKSIFKEQTDPPSASVALHLHAGQTLATEQVRGVRQLVAASVAGLKPDMVVVVDSHGNLLDAADPGTSDKRADLERTLTARVRMMLERVVGAGKASVVITAVVDERKINETAEVFDNLTPTIRSESRVLEGPFDGNMNIGGVAGTRGNLPGAPGATPIGPVAGPNLEGARRLQETKNYEISRTVRQTAKPDIELKKLHLAVVLDYKTGADGKPAARTAPELAELTALARQAAGIDDARGDKIEVRSIPFAPDPEPIVSGAADTGKKLPLLYLAGGGGLLLLLLIVAVVMLRGKKAARGSSKSVTLALPAPIGELERVLEARPRGIDGRTMRELEQALDARGLPAGNPTRERVLDAVRNDVERTAEVLTAWLSEVPVKGAKS